MIGQVILSILISLWFLPACSSNWGPGIEGQVKVHGLNVPAPGVKVEVITQTDIREEKARARFSTSTDSAGRFVIKGLLPNKNYKVMVNDPKFSSTEAYVMTSYNGTRIMNSPLTGIPIPPQDGLWVYTATLSSPKRILLKTKIADISRLFLYEGTYECRYYAFYLENNKLEANIAAIIPRHTLIVSKNNDFKDIAILSRILPNKFLVSGTFTDNNIPVVIKDGWYYNVSKFIIKQHVPWSTAMGLQWTYYEPLKDVMSDEEHNLWAFPVSSVKFIILATSVYDMSGSNIQCAGVYDKKNCPLQGILIKIER